MTNSPTADGRAIPPTFTFTASEVAAVLGQPEAFEEAACWNETQEAEADSMGMNSCAEHHKARAYELRQIRNKLMDAGADGRLERYSPDEPAQKHVPCWCPYCDQPHSPRIQEADPGMPTKRCSW